jgi:hypothetical protein
MTVDVWEHAYYVDYRNARPKYLEAIWDKINWDFVAPTTGRRTGAHLQPVPHRGAGGARRAPDRAAGMDRVFFGNSGAEANEAAIKLARLHAHQRGIERPQIVVLENSLSWSHPGHPDRHRQPQDAGRLRAAGAGLFVRVPRDDLDALQRDRRQPTNIAAVWSSRSRARAASTSPQA